MTFTLHVDSDRWRQHLTQLSAAYHEIGVELVPVVKGNGYGFGRSALAQEAARMGLAALAVGTVFEVEQALADFPGTCVVLEPFLPSDQHAATVWRRVLRFHATRVVMTVAGPHIPQASAAGATRIIIEGVTSLRRFGMQPREIDAALRATTVTIEGLTLHLPLAEPEPHNVAMYEAPGRATTASGWLRECLGWSQSWSSLAAEHGLPLSISVSHLTRDDLTELRSYTPGVRWLARVGTDLWLGDPGALRVTGTVLAIHEAGLGHSAVGYSQVDSHGNRRILVVSGGTSHGVSLAAPSSPTSLRRRGIALAEGFAQAAGKVRSPFRQGRQRFAFVEPPHMHVSMLWCEASDVAVGDELECRVRHTTATFDRVAGLD